MNEKSFESFEKIPSVKPIKEEVAKENKPDLRKSILEQKVKNFLNEIGDLADKHTSGFYPHDNDIKVPPVNIESFEIAVEKLKNISERPGDNSYLKLVKGALYKAEGKTFEEVFELGNYIRRGQYTEMLWMANCIFLADRAEQLDKLSNERSIVGIPGMLELWEKRKKELEKSAN